MTEYEFIVWAKSAKQPLLMILIAAIALLSGSGCQTPKRQRAVPYDRTTQATIPGVPGARYYLRDDLDRWVQDAIDSQEGAVGLGVGGDVRGARKPGEFLALSGGGDKGAFGAGLLVGWTERGDRPTFDVVTGISTGALIAPFAFLGPEYDYVLREVFTNVGPDDIFENRWILAALFNDAMADSKPLGRLIARHVTAELLERIAAEYARGRWLMVVTTDLDSRRPVIWNLGIVARTGTPEALDLFRKVLLASASIPGAFPPVMLDVELDGESYQEMHVDGGAVAQTFLFPPSFTVALRERELLDDHERHVYVIRNSRVDPEWASVDRLTLSILGRASSALLQSQGLGDLNRIYLVSLKNGMNFNLAYIPPTFDAPHKENFDTEYMRALFELARRSITQGDPWVHLPPGFEATTSSRNGSTQRPSADGPQSAE